MSSRARLGPVARFARALSLACALGASASAQQFPTCPLPGNAGPDVIVGDLNGAFNYTAVGNLEALAVGTTSCNVGTVWLNWIASSVQHPVIGASLYRFQVVNGSGRFEELGQSWVKHTFIAFSENLCCSSCTPTDGTHLGVGCSDPYAPSRNGTQAGLGPRWQVSPHGGFFVYPPPHPSGGNDGRLQVDVADLVDNSASGNPRYLAEAMYVAPDDSVANNGDNNASWRDVRVTGSGTAFDFTLIGATHRMEPAIFAWPACEPGVTLVEVAVPEGTSAPYDGFGRMVLGYKVTDLGNGTWHYEYALYNQNSDRAARAFTIPLGAGTVLTNVEFHDVAYRGGDGPGGTDLDGTDWPMTQGPDEITWSTQAFLQNTRANALRWGTTYNFRFDSDLPPSRGRATLALYRADVSIAIAGVDVPGLPLPGRAECFGDGLVPGAAACPCANFGAPGRGCGHSASTNGALLAGAGAIDPDQVVLDASDLPAATSCMFLAGDALAGGAPFGDGITCLTGTIARLATKSAAGGSSSYPEPGDPSLSAATGTTPNSGVVAHYQAVYRNASASFCPPSTWNTTNGYRVTW